MPKTEGNPEAYGGEKAHEERARQKRHADPSYSLGYEGSWYDGRPLELLTN